MEALLNRLLANSADPDQMLLYAASDQSLHCLQIVQPFFFMNILKLKMDSSNI